MLHYILTMNFNIWLIIAYTFILILSGGKNKCKSCSYYVLFTILHSTKQNGFLLVSIDPLPMKNKVQKI